MIRFAVAIGVFGSLSALVGVGLVVDGIANGNVGNCIIGLQMGGFGILAWVGAAVGIVALAPRQIEETP